MHLRKRVLVTGGSGFLGSLLCERLLTDGHEVLCVDNFFSSARANKVVSLTDSASKIVYAPLPCDDPRQRKPRHHTCPANIELGATSSIGTWPAKDLCYFEGLLRNGIA